MTVTRTDLGKVVGEILFVVETVESGINRLYLGTNRGKIYKYNGSTGAITTLQDFKGKLTCGVYDASTYIYFGADDGTIYRYTVSSGAVTVLLAARGDSVNSLVLYSSTLYVGYDNGKFATVTVS